MANYGISELKLTGVMANVAAFKHFLRNANLHVYCDHSALVHILKAKREPPTLRLKKLIENLSEYKFDIYFLKGNFPDHLLYLKEVCGLPEQKNYIPYHEDDFMFLFSDDKHDNMSLHI